MADLESVEVTGACALYASAAHASSALPGSALPLHLQHLVSETHGLTDEQKAELEKLLLSYEHCFEGGRYGLGRTTVVEHHIDTGDSKPVKVPARRSGGLRDGLWRRRYVQCLRKA